MFKENKPFPKHVGIIISTNKEKQIDEKSFENINEIIKSQIKNKIPMLTIYVPKQLCNEKLSQFLESPELQWAVKGNQIKISILGKWYDMPVQILESIKKSITETKDYDKYFLNLCINYDGQQEIVDACKIIAMKIKNGKLDPEAITKEDIKENLYTSYFLPPDMIIKTGKQKKTKGFMLWDSTNSEIYFTEEDWEKFSAKEFEKIINS
jgi:undecaprenyl diphosphate synthase